MTPMPEPTRDARRVCAPRIFRCDERSKADTAGWDTPSARATTSCVSPRERRRNTSRSRTVKTINPRLGRWDLRNFRNHQDDGTRAVGTEARRKEDEDLKRVALATGPYERLREASCAGHHGQQEGTSLYGLRKPPGRRCETPEGIGADGLDYGVGCRSLSARLTRRVHLGGLSVSRVPRRGRRASRAPRGGCRSHGLALCSDDAWPASRVCAAWGCGRRGTGARSRYSLPG
jgi:hypothetical protein